MATKIQLRRDAAADWTSANPTLAAGEFGYESDTTKFKIGDGATAWNSLAYKTGEGFKLVADDSATITVAEEGTLYVQGGTNVTTSTDSAGVLTINATGEVTASSTTTFTNKTFDAEATGNSLSNVDVANLKSGVLDTDLSSVSGSDDTLASAKAIKAYVDANAGGGGSTGDITFTGSTIQSPSNADITLEPSGTGDIVMPAISIKDNLITTNRSNDDLKFGTNGTGRFDVSTDGSSFFNNPLYSTYFGDVNYIKTMGISSDETVNANSADRNYMIGVAQNTTVSGSSSSNSNFRQRTLNLANSVDMAGFSYTRSGLSRGPKAGQLVTNVVNSGSSASTLNVAQGSRNYVASYDESNAGTYAAGDLTVTHAIACSGEFEIFTEAGSGSFTYTNAYNFKTDAFIASGHTITNLYGYYYTGADSSGTLSNEYAFYDASNGAQSLIGGVTLQNGTLSTDGVSIVDNEITASRSNDDLEISANGTGTVQIAGAGTFASPSNGNVNIMYHKDHAKAFGSKCYANRIEQDIKIDSGASDSTSSNDRYRNLMEVKLDLNGKDSTASNNVIQRGPHNMIGTEVVNSASGDSILGNASANNNFVLGETTGSGDLTINLAAGNTSSIEGNAASGTTITFADARVYNSIAQAGGSGTNAITNLYHFKANTTAGFSVTNEYGVHTPDEMQSLIGGVTLQNGDLTTTGIQLQDNCIKTHRSNDNLYFKVNGTGQIQLTPNGGDFDDYSANSRFANGNMLYYQEYDDVIGDGNRSYKNMIMQDIRLRAGQNSSNSNDRWRNQAQTMIDLNGSSTTAQSSSYRSRGPMGLEAYVVVNQTSSTASNLGQVSGGNYGVSMYPDGSGDITLTNGTGMGVYFEVMNNSGDIAVTDWVSYESIGLDRYETGGSPGSFTMTDMYHFRAGANSTSGSNATLTNNYAFYAEAESVATNKYAFYDAGANISRFGSVILANQSGDPSGVADSSHIYAKDDSSSSEVFVRDEAGNVTKISPHNKQGEWEYYSVNKKTGKKVRVNMERMIKKLEEITGETFIESE